MSEEDSQYLRKAYIPYDYWYTITLKCDNHVDFDNIPEKVSDILSTCYPNQPKMKME